MKTELSNNPAGDGAASGPAPVPAVTPAEKPACRDWAVTIINQEPPARQPQKPARGKRAVALKTEQPAMCKPAVRHAVAVIHKRADDAQDPTDTPPAPGKAPRPESRAAELDRLLAPPPSGGKFAPIAFCLVVVLAVGAGVATHLSRQKAAERRAAESYATVTGFIARVEELKKQAAPCQQQLEKPISELKSIVAAPAPGQDDAQRISSAIAVVATVESAFFGAETNEEQAQRALAALARHPDYQALSSKMRTALADYQGQQKAVESKCQSVRSMIMAANARMPRRGR